MTDALTVRESAPPVIVPRTLEEMISLAERLATSSLLPAALRNKVPEVLMQIMAGQELGLYSMASLRSFHIIEGKPTMAADAMVAIVLGSGKAEYFRRVGEGTADAVTYETKRVGQPPQRCTWTIQMAKDAGLSNKDNWRLYKRQLLASRAKSELARDVYPDVLAGCYTTDEVGDRAPNAPTESRVDDVQDAEIVERPKPTEPIDIPELAEIVDATTIDQLKEIATRFSARRLAPGHPAYDVVNGAYKTRLRALKAVPTKPIASDASSSAEGSTPTNSDDSSNASTGEV